MRFTFGSRDLIRCLANLGFTPEKQLGTSHQKFTSPKEKASRNPGQRPFVIVQHGQKQYDPHARTRYLRQVMNLGFTEKEIVEAFKK